MEKLFCIGGILLTVSLAILWLRFAVKFDLVIAALYENNRERWRELGSPMGFFWSPRVEDRVKFRESTNSRNELASVFLFKRGEFNRMTSSTDGGAKRMSPE
jgi:hypothetical protein